VWAFNAWNMAYNISVTLRTPEERWRWVKNGIELLRDRGIPRNPRNTQMYRELAWIFFHKVGDFLDDQHWYYKLQLALMMEDILGPGPEHDYQALADAPHDWPTLVADQQIAELVRRFSDLGHDVSRPGVFFGLLNRNDLPEETASLLNDESSREALRRIELFWRAKRLRDEVKLDPARIVDLREAYGPVDFRLAEAHALYWASMGVEIGTDRRTAFELDKLNTSRIEFYCLQNFFRQGRLIMSPSAHLGEPPMLMPDIRFADRYRQTLMAISERFPKQEAEGAVGMNFQSALINFMREASLRFNEAGRIDKSREYFDWLVQNYPDSYYDGGYEMFIRRQWEEDQKFSHRRSATARIMALVSEGVQMIAYGEYEDGAARVAYARRLWRDYEKAVVAETRRLHPFDTIYEYVVHELGSQMRPETYERLLRHTGFTRPAQRMVSPFAEEPTEPRP
jgi:hypothetical protein